MTKTLKFIVLILNGYSTYLY